MENVELSETLVKELFVNWLPRIWFIPVDEDSKNIVRVVCDFWLMDCRNINDILKKFGYEFNSEKFDSTDIADTVNNIVKT